MQNAATFHTQTEEIIIICSLMLLLKPVLIFTSMVNYALFLAFLLSITISEHMIHVIYALTQLYYSKYFKINKCSNIIDATINC